jgi:hypothetical protein
MIDERNVTLEKLDLFHAQAAQMARKLAPRRINFYPCDDKAAALETILSLVRSFQLADRVTRIGFADSVTLHQLDVFQNVKAMENTEIINPMERFDDGKYVVFGQLPPGPMNLPHDEYYKIMNRLWDKMRESLDTDVFIIGANAITASGQIVSTDGTGNRVGGMIFGPRRVIVVVGRNKVCKNLDEAIQRNRNVAAPLNYFRHNQKHHNRFDNPCMKTGACLDCSSPRRGCLKTVIIDGEMEGFKDRTHLVLVNDDLGL